VAECFLEVAQETKNRILAMVCLKLSFSFFKTLMVELIFVLEFFDRRKRRRMKRTQKG